MFAHGEGHALVYILCVYVCICVCVITILRYNLYLSRPFFLAQLQKRRPLRHKNINVENYYNILYSLCLTNVRLLSEEADAILIIAPIRLACAKTNHRTNHIFYFVEIKKKDYIGEQSQKYISSRARLNYKIIY